MDHESDWQVVTKKPPQKESIGTSIPKSTSFKRNIENSNHGASMKSLNKSPNSKQTPGILKIQPGLEVKKPNVSMNSLPQPPKMKTNTAKKVTNSIALFDLILLSNSKKTSSNMITPTARQANITAKKEAIEDLKPKTFIANKKKKQRISTVKKRLLLERLKNFKLSENTNIQQKSKDDEVFDFDRSLYCTVLIFNFFCAAELSDEEEREEVLSNAREVLSTFGTIESLEMGIEPLPSSSISAVTATVDSCDCVIARFGDYSAAQSATAHLQGLTFGGATVSLHLVSNNRPFNSVPSRTSIDKVATRSNVNIASPVHSRHDNVDTPVPSPSTDVIHSPGPGISQHMVVSAVESLQQQYALPATLFVENMLEEADARDPEETAELLNDIRSLCEGFPSLCSVWLEQRTRRHVDPSISSFTVTGSGSGGNDGDNEGEGASLGDHSLTSYISSTECIAIPSGLPWALIEFNDLKTAINCIHAIKSSKSDEQPSNQFHGQFLQPRLYNYSAYLGHQFEDKWFIDINPDLSFGIILHQFVEHDQLVDEEEKEDIIDDIRAILFSSVNLQQSSGDIAISFWESIQTQTMSTINSTDLDTSHLLHVLVTCSTLDACCTALDHLHSQVVTGSRVSASIVSMTIDQVVFSQDSTKGDIGAVLHCNLVHTGSNAGAVVAVTDCAFLTLSDSIDAKDRIDDEYEKNLRTELLLYIRNQIHSHYSSSEYIHIKRVALITTSNSSSNSAMSKIDLISVDSQSEAKNLSDINFPVDLPTTIVACISFNSHIDAERAMLKLDGSLVGGSKINVYLETNVVDQSAIIAEDDSDTHHVDQKNSISMKASAHRVSLVARLDIPSVSILNNDTDVLSPYSANTNRSRFTFRHDSRAINRIATARSIKAYERVTPRVTGDIESVVSIPRKRIGAESFSSMDGLTANTEAVTSRPPGESIYKEAKATPKLQKHVEAPSELPTADADLCITITSFLKSISEFQTRAEEKDPIKAKQHLRFVVGMKQVLNGVKASRARLVLLAPDTEVSDVLDNKVALIIQEAKERNIPVLYCLTRRKLGKSLGMSMKQSAAAIYDPSGVHDAFTKIIKFVELFHLAKTNLSLELPIGNLSLAVNASMDEYSQPMSPITPNESRSIVNSQSMAKVRANEIISNISTTAEMKNTTNEPEDSESINNSIIQSPAVSKIKFQEQEHDVSTNRLSIESSVSMITNPEDRLFTLPEDSVAVDDFKSVGTKVTIDPSAASPMSRTRPQSRRLSMDGTPLTERSFRTSATPRSSRRHYLPLTAEALGIPIESTFSTPRTARTVKSVRSRKGTIATARGVSMVNTNSTVVIDNGSYMIRAGFSLDEFPRSIFPSAVAITSPPDGASINSKDDACYYVGQKALLQEDMYRPYQNGQVTQWEDMEAIWEHAFSDCLQIDTNGSKVFLTEAHMPPKATRERTLESMFELFNVEATYLHVQPVLALFSAGLTSGCVVDSGEFSTTVYPVADGYHLVNGSRKLKFGGIDICDIVENKILAQNEDIYSESLLQLLSDPVNDPIRNIKERFCRVKNLSYSINEDTNKSEGSKNSMYTLPDGTSINIDTTEISTSTERFFDSTLFGDICEPEEYSIPQTIHKCIMNAGVDLRRSLLSAIVLTGGNSMFPGLPERLTSELKSLFPGTMSTSLKVIAPPDRCNAIWNGGSILTSLSTFEDQWITGADYDEYGAEIVHQKCTVYL